MSVRKSSLMLSDTLLCDWTLFFILQLFLVKYKILWIAGVGLPFHSPHNLGMVMVCMH